MSTRETVVRWQDPSSAFERMPSMSGLEYLQAMAAGELPGAPIASHFGMDVADVSEGSITFTAVPDESHYNPIGMVHGGLVCTLLDSALGCAAQTLLPAGMGYSSIEIKVNYLRPVGPNSGPLKCVGRVTKPGRRVSFADAEVFDKDEKLLATASGSVLIFPLPTA